VVLKIVVNQKGNVDEAGIIEAVSTTSDPCLIETALATARISRFNPDISAPRLQTGTLTYHFVAQ
jgi:outer membrane biosynthesis protein TonB